MKCGPVGLMWSMLSGLTSRQALLLALSVAPTPSWAQYDLSTCTGSYNYCVELSRRSGQSTTQCEVARQQCMRTGNAPDYNNPRSTRPAQVERR
jgi:hypothetical protein